MQLNNLQIPSIPDYSYYINKEFIVTEDKDLIKTEVEYPFKKGLKFKIKSIKNNYVKIKITNSEKELYDIGMLDYAFNAELSYIEDTIGELEKVLKMWQEEDKFIVDEDDFWNSDRGNGKGHCINTGYNNIPENHPDKYGMAKAYYFKDQYSNKDSIMTLNYKRIDGKLNIYSYQKGTNTFYSKNTYEYMLLGDKDKLENWKSKDKNVKKQICRQIFNIKDIKIKTLNKIKIEELN